MTDAGGGLWLEGLLLPMRTDAALLITGAAGWLVGLRTRTTGTLLTRVFPAAALGATAGLLPTFAPADPLRVLTIALAVAFCGAAALAGSAAAEVDAGIDTGAARRPWWRIVEASIAGLAAFLGAQASFARFLPGELPVAVSIGTVCALAVTLAGVALLVSTARRTVASRWMDVALRTIASWLAAIGLLLLALVHRGG